MPLLFDPVDVETLAIGFLTTALGFDPGEVSGELPPTWKANDRHLRLTRVGGIPVARGHLDRARLQLEGFGSSAIEAHDITAAALHALLELGVTGATFGPVPGSDHEGPLAAVTGSEQTIGLANRPDPVTGAPRYLAEVILFVHGRAA